jgi:hypothetical protein
MWRGVSKRAKAVYNARDALLVARRLVLVINTEVAAMSALSVRLG